MTVAEQHEKNPERVAAGLKAAIHNPNVSEEAKEQAAAQLKNMGTEVDTQKGGHESNRVLGMNRFLFV